MAFIKVVIILIPSCLERVHHLRVIDPIFLVIILMITIIYYHLSPMIITTRIFGKHLIMPFELSNIFLPTGFNGRYFFFILMLNIITVDIFLLRQVLFLIHHVMVIRIINVLVPDLKVIMLVIILMLSLLL